MTSEMVLGMDRDWREFMLEEAGGIGYFVFRFLGWSSVVMGAGMLLYALIRTLEAQKAQPKAQWPTDIPGQSQPYAPRPVGGSGQTQTQNASAEQTATQGEPETIFCPKCGRKQRKSNAACWACGANLQDK